MIKQDWPKSKADITLKFQKYFPFREEISTQDGVVFKGKRILVPFTPRQLMSQIEFPISSFTKYMPVTWVFRGVSGELKKPSTGEAFTSKLQSSPQGAAFATATNQNSGKNL